MYTEQEIGAWLDNPLDLSSESRSFDEGAKEAVMDIEKLLKLER